jgi:hypothetical protein
MKKGGRMHSEKELKNTQRTIKTLTMYKEMIEHKQKTQNNT